MVKCFARQNLHFSGFISFALLNDLRPGFAVFY